MSEEKKDTRPFWMQLRDKKLGAPSNPEKAKREVKDALTVWFDTQATMSPANCENCGGSLASTINFHGRAHICHIVPKSPTNGCPSVATHPLNRWFGCSDCHNEYDRAPREVVATMAIISICRERLAMFVNEIAQNEIRRVPAFLLPETLTFERQPTVAPQKKAKPVKPPKKAKKQTKQNGKAETEKPQRGPGGKFIPKQRQ